MRVLTSVEFVASWDTNIIIENKGLNIHNFRKCNLSFVRYHLKEILDFS